MAQSVEEIKQMAQRWNEINVLKKKMSQEAKDITPHLIAFLQTNDQEGFCCDGGANMIYLKKLPSRKKSVNKEHIKERLCDFFDAEDTQVQYGFTYTGEPEELANGVLSAIYENRELTDVDEGAGEDRYTLAKKAVPKPKRQKTTE